ncbi:hypothetical protein L1987_13271 [Smallanthus sonchifolius]|uniref:Uncharacterized protein n=1 Tax=Smallanthus sonchifolius TaxID=185202 RepID=A0ACB9JGM5_9ASTR|nr:hypothetical protein L1987_13271 [Smallanthus sonchifolius]
MYRTQHWWYVETVKLCCASRLDALSGGMAIDIGSCFALHYNRCSGLASLGIMKVLLKNFILLERSIRLMENVFREPKCMVLHNGCIDWRISRKGCLQDLGFSGWHESPNGSSQVLVFKCYQQQVDTGRISNLATYLSKIELDSTLEMVDIRLL